MNIKAIPIFLRAAQIYLLKEKNKPKDINYLYEK